MRVLTRRDLRPYAISKAISGAGNGHLLCECAMLFRAIGALSERNDNRRIRTADTKKVL
jgi:hypothetical protein